MSASSLAVCRATASLCCVLLALWAAGPCHARAGDNSLSSGRNALHQQPLGGQHSSSSGGGGAHVRRLSQASGRRDWGDSGDPSGLGGILGAHVIMPRPAARNNRAAVTAEAAEASAASAFVGVFRPTTQEARRSYATVEGAQGANPERDKVTVRPRARSAQDLGRTQAPKPPNLGSGDENIGAVTMGTLSLAETYEGAEAVAASDAVALLANGGRKPTTAAFSMLTSRPGVLQRADASKRRSTGVSAGVAVSSIAGSGQANSRIALAQAESAVAMAQTQRGTADAWQH